MINATLLDIETGLIVAKKSANDIGWDWIHVQLHAIPHIGETISLESDWKITNYKVEDIQHSVNPEKGTHSVIIEVSKNSKGIT